eukprot:366130-Amphidinium_carterae.1
MPRSAYAAGFGCQLMITDPKQQDEQKQHNGRQIFALVAYTRLTLARFGSMTWATWPERQSKRRSKD